MSRGVPPSLTRPTAAGRYWYEDEDDDQDDDPAMIPRRTNSTSCWIRRSA